MKKRPVMIPEFQLMYSKRDGYDYILDDKFGEALQEALFDTGLSVEDVAKSIGVARTTLYDLIAGRTKTIRRKTAWKLSTLSTWSKQGQEADTEMDMRDIGVDVDADK